MDQTSTIHSVDTGFIYAVFMLLFSKQYKIFCVVILHMRKDDGKQHENKFCTAQYCRNALI